MAAQQADKNKKFGTFLGVYTPSILTILGLIMYLRFGWVVGNLGLILTIVVVLLASSITFITGLSASAIATNIRVGVGGEYYLISRSLGLEPGGAIGIPLYLSRTLSVTFYAFGLSESILALWPETWGLMPGYSMQLLAAAIIIIITLLSGKSASLALKAQIPIMIFVGLSILALIGGVLMHDFKSPEFTPTYRTAPEGFWYVFAVFFPAVTGFTAGIGMSGDLKSPRKSIPKGTLGAVISGAVLYMIIPVILSITILLNGDDLADPNAGIAIWTRVAIFGNLLVMPAVWGAILSSGFGSILAGPRVLQALAMDGLAPKFLGKLSKSGQPTMATWVSGGLALLAIFLGELNTVAEFVSILFLTLYVAINLSAAMEKLVSDPFYRPRIKVAWWISMLGAFGALWVMFLINPWACIVAMGLELALFLFLKSRALEQRWGDVAAGFWYNLTRFGLIRLERRKIDARNWRPILIIFSHDVDHRLNLIRFSTSLGQSHGIVTIMKLLEETKEISNEEIVKEREIMSVKLEKYGLEAICEVDVVKNIQEGILHVAESHGIGGLKSNTVVMNWSRKGISHKIGQLKMIRDLIHMRKSVIMPYFGKNYLLRAQYKQIDIWWHGKQRNGDLMLLCAYLLKLNDSWRKAQITIHSVVHNEEERSRMSTGIKNLLPQARIDARVLVSIKNRDESFSTILHRESRDTDLVFLGLAAPEEGKENDIAIKMDRLCEGLKRVVFVKNNNIPGTLPILLDLEKY